MLRKIKRQKLKNQLHSNNIGHTWRKLQIKKFGEKYWLYMYNRCVSKLRKAEIYI